MKNLFCTLCLLLVLSVTALAQRPMTKPAPNRAAEPMSDYSEEDINRYMEAKIDMRLQTAILEALDLSSEEIMEFRPLYTEYQTAMDAIEDRRSALIREHRDEMKEDNSPESEENEKADFVENYWELDIDVLELKKDFFDRIEDEIGLDRALSFFALEDMYTSRINRMRLRAATPTLVLIETPRVSYQSDVDAYQNWNRVNVDGKVGISHEFTAGGLKKLWNVAGSIAMAEGVKVPNLKSNKQQVMQLADKMKQDWRSMKHADQARQAFMLTAETLKAICMSDQFDSKPAAAMRLTEAAKAINAEMKLTDQADAVYNFFNQAEMVVNDLVKQANSESYGRKMMKMER